MKLYASVRVLRGVALGALTHDPAAAAVVAELASVTPLCYNATATVGGVLALAYSGTLAAWTLDILERPMRRALWMSLVLCRRDR